MHLMPRYFFNMSDAAPDSEGIFLNDVRQLRALAIKTAAQVLGESPSFGMVTRGG
jgi:hypothetical protein